MPLPAPIGRQREVLALPARGHVAVLGTAGSGKTTLAILRAAFLSDPHTTHAGRTLLVTFNRQLVAYLKHLQEHQLANVVTENYHTFARGYLSARGKMRTQAICEDKQRTEILEGILEEYRSRYPNEPILQETTGTIVEEIAFIARHNIDSLSLYESIGTGSILDLQTEPGRQRRVVWAIYRTYLTRREKRGWLYDWDDVAAAVCHELDSDDSPRMYRHIVIDEGQDFSPAMIKSLTKAVPPDGTVTFFGDVAQQIYGHRMTWCSAGLEIATPYEFRENYRNSRQVADLALAVSRMPYFIGVPDIVAPVAPVAAGPLPTLIQFPSVEAELDFVAQQVEQNGRTQSVAILVRRRQDEPLLRRRLSTSAVRLHRETALHTLG